MIDARDEHGRLLPITDLQVETWSSWLELDQYRPKRADIYAAQTAMYGKVAISKPGTTVDLLEMLYPVGKAPPRMYFSPEELAAKEEALKAAIEEAKAERASRPGTIVITKTREEMERDGPEFELRELGRRKREQLDREKAKK